MVKNSQNIELAGPKKRTGGSKPPPIILKNIYNIYMIYLNNIFIYLYSFDNFGMGLGGVQKAKTRQIDASEIIGKAGSSEQEGPNHPKSPSKT